MEQSELQLMDDAYWAPLPDVLSIAQVAKILRKGDVTVWRWLAAGKIPGHLLRDRAWVIYKEEVRLKIENPDRHPVLPEGFLSGYPDELSPVELAEIIGKTKQTVYKWLGTGDLPGHYLDGNWLLYKSETTALLQRTSNQITNPPA